MQLNDIKEVDVVVVGAGNAEMLQLSERNGARVGRGVRPHRRTKRDFVQIVRVLTY